MYYTFLLILLFPQYSFAAIETASGAIFVFLGIFILPAIVIVLLLSLFGSKKNLKTQEISLKNKVLHLFVHLIHFSLSILGGFLLLNIFIVLKIFHFHNDILFVSIFLITFSITYFLLGKIIKHFKK